MDTTTLCLIAIIVIAAIFLIPRLMGNSRKVDFSQRGNESPRVDSPEISSRGGFGGDADSQAARGDERPRYDDRDIDSRGGFGRDRPNETRDSSSASSFAGTTPPKRDFDDKDKDDKKGGAGLSGFRTSGGGSTKRDDDDVESRGGFGRNKD